MTMRGHLAQAKYMAEQTKEKEQQEELDRKTQLARLAIVQEDMVDMLNLQELYDLSKKGTQITDDVVNYIDAKNTAAVRNHFNTYRYDPENLRAHGESVGIKPRTMDIYGGKVRTGDRVSKTEPGLFGKKRFNSSFFDAYKNAMNEEE